MHLFLTDRLTCPRCGPGFGLILLAHEVLNQRVLEGDLGCPNCREKYPVRAGFGDLRAPPRQPLQPPLGGFDSTSVDAEEVFKIGALLGVTEGPGTLLLQGPAARMATSLAELIGGVEVVGLDPSLMEGEEAEGVSRIVSHPRIPFSSGTFTAVLFSGKVTEVDLDEGSRVVKRWGRIVVLDPQPELTVWVEARGLEILLREAGVLVFQRVQAENSPLVTLRGL